MNDASRKDWWTLNSGGSSAVLRIGDSFLFPVTRDEELIDVLEVPANSGAEAIGSATASAFSGNSQLSRSERAKRRRELKKRSWFNSIVRLEDAFVPGHVCLEGMRNGQVEIQFEKNLYVIAGRGGAILKVRKLAVPTSMAALGKAVIECWSNVANPPKTRFPLLSSTSLAARSDGYLLSYMWHGSRNTEGLGTWYDVEKVPLAVDDEELGRRLIEALENPGRLAWDDLDARAKAFMARPESQKLIDARDGAAKVDLYFKASDSRTQLTLHARGPALKRSISRKLPVTVRARNLGAAIRELLKKAGARVPKPGKAAPAREFVPPLDDLCNMGGYRALVVHETKNASAAPEALAALRKLKIVEWIESAKAHEAGAPWAARVRDAALENCDQVFATLAEVSRHHAVNIVMALATRSTDILVYTAFSKGEVKRALVYGLPEQHSWTAVEGKAEPWEKKTDLKDLKKKSADVFLADAMGVAEAAIRAAYT